MSSVVFSSVFSTAPLVGVVGVEDDLVSVDVVVPSCSSNRSGRFGMGVRQNSKLLKLSSGLFSVAVSYTHLTLPTILLV